MSDFFDDMTRKVSSRLIDLNERARLLFSISCVYALYPSFVKFNGVYKHRDVEPIVKALKGVEHSILCGSALDFFTVDELMDLAPDTNEYDDIFASLCLDFVASLEMLNRVLCGEDVAKDISELCIDSVDMYVQNLITEKYGDVGFELAIKNHHLMKNELIRQLTVLSSLDGQLEDSKVACLFEEWRSYSGIWVIIQ
ncbi:DUF416 family protein [Chitinibacter tainanensis]|uniref:DUF416 family protein n=1 Tax=Chitinibacter tainanensis TaxID=230667 RepID=UPI002356C8C3|nr:DUF416 family protein [Chitinibacter tainanensis]